MRRTPMKNHPKHIRQRTFEFALRTIKLCNELNKKPGVCREISRQLFKAGTSVGANTEEAQAAQSRADFISKNSIALKDARESHFWLRVLIGNNVRKKTRRSQKRS